MSLPAHSSSSLARSAGVLSLEGVRRRVERFAAGLSPEEVETVDLLAGLGRVLAEGILADRDFPPFARATRDGYAVRGADVAEIAARLEVVGEVKAGDWPEPGVCSVGRGQAVGIMTGAPLPEGADAVVMVEHTLPIPEPAVKLVEVRRSISAGENFVPRGAEARAGQRLLASETPAPGGWTMPASRVPRP